MKKVLAIVAIVALAASFTACNSSTEGTVVEGNDSTSVSVTPVVTVTSDSLGASLVDVMEAVESMESMESVTVTSVTSVTE